MKTHKERMIELIDEGKRVEEVKTIGTTTREQFLQLIIVILLILGALFYSASLPRDAERIPYENVQ